MLPAGSDNFDRVAQPAATGEELPSGNMQRGITDRTAMAVQSKPERRQPGRVGRMPKLFCRHRRVWLAVVITTVRTCPSSTRGYVLSLACTLFGILMGTKADNMCTARLCLQPWASLSLLADSKTFVSQAVGRAPAVGLGLRIRTAAC